MASKRKKSKLRFLKGRGLPPEVTERGKKELEEILDEGKKALQARGQAIRYAEQTDGLIGKVQFPDGVQRYVVFRDGRPRACFPVLEGVEDLSDLPAEIERALPDHDLGKLELKAPEDWRRKIRKGKDDEEILDLEALPEVPSIGKG